MKPSNVSPYSPCRRERERVRRLMGVAADHSQVGAVVRPKYLGSVPSMRLRDELLLQNVATFYPSTLGMKP